MVPGWCTGVRGRRLGLVLGLVLYLPALGVGLVMDDWFHRMVLLGLPGAEDWGAAWRSLFTFLPGPGRNGPLIDMGLLPWWANPDVRVSFFRPLAALSAMLDARLWPDAPALYHLHSLAWWGAGLLAVAWLYRRHLPPGVAGLALLLFAIDDTHAWTAAWVANRNGLIALLFGVLAIGWHTEGRRGRALLAAVLGLGAGEPFVGALGYLLAWELTRGGPRRVRAARVLPYALLLVGWRLLYQVEGYGASGSGLYVDPGRQPLLFIQALAERGPLLAASQVLGLPIDFWLLLSRPVQLGVSAGAAVGVGLVVAWLLPLVRTSRTARFLALGTLLSLVPPCGALPTDRLLLWPGLGALALLALAADRTGWLVPEQPATRGRRLVGALLLLHLPVAALKLPARILALPAMGSLFTAGAVEAPRDGDVAHQTLVFVNGSELMVSYAAALRAVIGADRQRAGLPRQMLPVPRRVALLSSMNTASTITRIDAQTLRIVPTGGFLATTMDTMFRSRNDPFTVGDRIVRTDFIVTVEAVTEDGRPASVRLQFGQPLDAGPYRFVAVLDGRVRPWPLPPVGASTVLPATMVVPDPWPLPLTGREDSAALNGMLGQVRPRGSRSPPCPPPPIRSPPSSRIRRGPSTCTRVTWRCNRSCSGACRPRSGSARRRRWRRWAP